ncbi:cation diffusion facilitator family transporter [Halobacteriovorax sp. DPLXC-1]|uniref:cation diffusion facilitator family transporter n=1 Tax=unclassified Halobacteriovorax TaxID=2639665 RepID=UPI002FF0D709
MSGGHHHHHHHHHHGDMNGKNILIAFFLNASFAVIELIGGYLTNSVAIYSDALHDIGDSLALLFSYFAEKLSKKEADNQFTFGYRRFSILSALINGLILFSGSIFVIYEAVQRIMAPEPVQAMGMLWLALLGIVVNGVAAYRMSKTSGLNQKMVMYHLLEDLMGWVAVLIVSVILHFKPWYILDSILSILISFIILRGVYHNLKKVGLIFLQHFPDEIEMNTIKEEVEALELVKDMHAIKGWSLDNESFYLRFHILVAPETKARDLDILKQSIKEVLSSHHVVYSTIEFESSTDCCE